MCTCAEKHPRQTTRTPSLVARVICAQQTALLGQSSNTQKHLVGLHKSNRRGLRVVFAPLLRALEHIRPQHTLPYTFPAQHYREGQRQERQLLLSRCQTSTPQLRSTPQPERCIPFGTSHTPMVQRARCGPRQSRPSVPLPIVCSSWLSTTSK
ncbi:hypothetical protein H310_10726 [Aphanomyces invadans]|uniref:Uncharacterized protein n=1 Tax=Aphanomyces invadans TaxID=157072 RepID=A0A024TPK1_9STRA|nr:hypothetical protein H310_10726 [Aphanomyces invadans]ETV96085.1 hypothetical protein H310_10726 [Aphanomyces invadans]|eukprot:XP_008875396.1 hypothetical protein H310_10726 [Aphanomyces invadans]